MIGQFSIAAATAVVGYDLAGDTVWQTAAYDRSIAAIGLAGSAAALDTEIRIMAGTVEVGNMFNSSTGAPNRDSMFRMGFRLPANTPVHLYIVDAPATNPINGSVDFA